MSITPESSLKHDALILRSRSSKLELIQQPTPNVGPHEVLIEVKNLALNPVDHAQQSMGFRVSRYPYVLGFDIAGIVHRVGSSVASFRPGDRVLAFASSWFEQAPEYGAFQKYVLVSSEQVSLLPPHLSLSFQEACILPLAVYTAWFGLLLTDIPRDRVFRAEEKKGILIWGAGGSIGSVTLQVAKTMGLHIYATASRKHHEYLKGLGNGPGQVKCFDYHDKDVIEQIVREVKSDGLTLDLGFEAAAGNLKDMVTILSRTKDPSSGPTTIICAPFSLAYLWYNFVPSYWSGTKVKFIEPPADVATRKKDFAFIFNEWLPEKLQSGEVVPSPKVELFPGGLAAVQSAVERLKEGVSGVKLVIEV